MRDVLWERSHGKPKRVTVICDILLATAHAAQSTALGSPKDAPLLNEDAAMMTVDAALVAQGSHLPCTREDARRVLALVRSARRPSGVCRPRQRHRRLRGIAIASRLKYSNQLAS